MHPAAPTLLLSPLFDTVIVLFGLDWIRLSSFISSRPTSHPGSRPREISTGPPSVRIAGFYTTGALCGSRLFCSSAGGCFVPGEPFQAPESTRRKLWPPHLRTSSASRSLPQTLSSRETSAFVAVRGIADVLRGPDLRSAWLDRPSSYVIFFIASIKTHFCCGHPLSSPLSGSQPSQQTEIPLQPPPERDIGALIVTTLLQPSVSLRRATGPGVETLRRNLP